jgi:DNA helicase HerA-like ATPase
MTDNELYLGRLYDPIRKQPTGKAFTYDSADLTTHAVVTGMTGSGKTGLCITLLEEAALQGIPALIIDPKGDLTNLLLHFPTLAPRISSPGSTLKWRAGLASRSTRRPRSRALLAQRIGTVGHRC